MTDPAVSPADTIRRALNLMLTVDRMQPAWESAEQALGALDALLAVGERDKAEIEDLRAQLRSTERLHELARIELGERDRQQIAQLTEALERIADPSYHKRFPPYSDEALKLPYEIARAVLAGKEDAE